VSTLPTPRTKSYHEIIRKAIRIPVGSTQDDIGGYLEMGTCCGIGPDEMDVECVIPGITSKVWGGISSTFPMHVSYSLTMVPPRFSKGGCNPGRTHPP